MTSARVRTRFAPSPTGYLHIGGVRTALFNWLFARRHGGSFILRIDDTDQQRNVEEALQPILHGFRWLGIDWDEGAEQGGPHAPYYQSQRQERYRAAARRLVERGQAYHDFARPEELESERDAAKRAGERFRYSRRFMAESEADVRRFEAEGRSGVVRLKMPRDGVCVFDDLVRGEMRVEWTQEQDHVIQRADGSCLYHLASVVDDHEMRISHVIRAEEHLSNTPRQIFIAEALGYSLPQYAHLPFVAEPGSKNKLSKRKLAKYLKNPDFARLNERGNAVAAALGLQRSAETFNPVIVDFYEQIGFLPQAVVNYLLLLGWSLDDRTEFFDRREMIEAFTLERVNPAAASFDPNKLLAFQEHYMAGLPLQGKVELVLPFLRRAGVVPPDPSGGTLARIERVLQAAGDRIKIAGDVLEYTGFFATHGTPDYDEAAFDKHVRRPEGAVELLQAFGSVLEELQPFDAPSLESALREFNDARGIKMDRIVQALRVALTGRAVGFGLFEAMEILGRERCRERLLLAVKRV